MTKDTNHQAFPSNQNGTGMSLRDYFAAKAMQGILSSLNTHDMTMQEISLISWEQADAMLKAREA